MLPNSDFQNLSRKDFSVIINDKQVRTPDFTQKATSRYRLKSEKILQKQCAKCERWFDVLILSKINGRKFGRSLNIGN